MYTVSAGYPLNQSTLTGMYIIIIAMSDALNVPLVSTVPCIYILWNTIHRFPEDEVHKGRMDYAEVEDTRNSEFPPM